MDKKYFIIKYAPIKENFLSESTEEERAIVTEHYYYLKAFHEKQELILAGRTMDAAFGIAIIACDSLENAREILAGDPAIAKNVFNGFVKEFSLALH